MRMRPYVLSFLVALLCTLSLWGISIAPVHAMHASSGEGQVTESSDSLDPLAIIAEDPFQFFLWAFIAALVIVVVFFISISRKLEEWIDPLLFRIKKRTGLVIGRVVLGLILIFSAYHGALFGPELTFEFLYGADAVPVVQIVLAIAGIFILLGFLSRIAALIVLVFYVGAAINTGYYMLSYINHLGEIFVVAALGQHVLSIDKSVLQWHGSMKKVARFIERYAFLILRVAFGFSIIYTAFHTKFFHGNLVLQSVIDHNLTQLLPTDPLFTVFGIFMIEVLIGIFFIIGFEVRFAALFLIGILTVSLIYSGDPIWSYLARYGIATALFIHGYDRYTIEGRFFKDAKHEPVL